MAPIRPAGLPISTQSPNARAETRPSAAAGGTFAAKLNSLGQGSAPAAPASTPAPAASQNTASSQSASQSTDAPMTQEDLAKGLREIMLAQGLMMGQQIMASKGQKIDSE